VKYYEIFCLLHAFLEVPLIEMHRIFRSSSNSLLRIRVLTLALGFWVKD
jgi:hypothetical protein